MSVVLEKMKRTIQSIVVLLALSVAGCRTPSNSHWHPTPEGIDPSVFMVMLPQIEMRSNTVEEAVTILLQHWRAAAGTDNLPLTVVVDYVDRDQDGKQHEIYEGYPGYRQKITFAAKNITVAECLDIIETLSPHHLTIRPAFLEFEARHWIEEDWVTTVIPVSGKSRLALGITDKTTSAELRATLESYGVNFEDWMELNWVPEVEKLVLTNLPREIEKIRGLIHLLDEGFTVERKEHNETRISSAR